MAVEYDPVVEGSSLHPSRAASRNDCRAPLPSAGPADRILFLVDHKHRDLPSLALISHYLRVRGREARLSALWQEEEQIRSFDPGFIVLPKPAYDNARLLRWYSEGRQLIVIDTEGAPQDITYKMRIEVPPDLYLFWSKREMEKYRGDLAGRKAVAAGCPRLDFLHSSLSGLFPYRRAILRELGLPETGKTITVATRRLAARLLKPAAKAPEPATSNQPDKVGSRGRYDNRMNPQDVADWIGRFEKANISLLRGAC